MPSSGAPTGVRSCSSADGPSSTGSRLGGASGGLIKPDTRVHPDVAEVADQFGHKANQREEVKRSEHDRVVAADDALVTQKAETVEGEQRFDQQRTGEERADERGRKTRDDRDQRIAEDVFPQHAALAQALGPRAACCGNTSSA